MIIVKLIGGLGNQMFQYAVGRSLALKHATELKLDRTFLDSEQNGYTRRKFELNCFNLNVQFASPCELLKFAVKDSSVLVKPHLWLRRLWNNVLLKSCVVKEKHFQFDSTVMQCHDNSYLAGYWQSEKYFQSVIDVIRNDFTFCDPLEGVNYKHANLITTTESVSLHVRRGDFIANSKAINFHGTCDLAYYQRAISHIAPIISSPHFFLFSDDPEWVRVNLQLDFPSTIIDNNTGSAGHHDMHLMSLCKHNIIANSSFSWWGAWLNRNPDKIVLAPKRWFNDPSINTEDIIPGWLRIEN
ncbi:alpha-1,2-fucosyltransferase [Geomobilimonas luticola]|uniref:Alpha-1,2-fucosyltransferase n=1 Tax=Geomobilimonas luticola TaxID=1114878 RepID=A0ABS5SEN8_9BACT|nr:alpha-1,2-fucosyltransferase [Geomobilimonas luticola]MBT0653117.1 alpha-1,2-fucosyltransferase [Geomobilimonas luticola]